MKGEQVFGIHRCLIEELLETKSGYIEDKKWYDYIKENLTLKDRESVENDKSFKQIIPFLIIEYNNQYLLHIRTKKQSEQRLHDKLSLGIGGHINPADNMILKDIVLEGLKRELNEEIDISLVQSPEFLGFINDDNTEVGAVHLGLIFMANASNENFNVREKDKMKCFWVGREQIFENYDRLESWSQIIANCLIN